MQATIFSVLMTVIKTYSLS